MVVQSHTYTQSAQTGSADTSIMIMWIIIDVSLQHGGLSVFQTAGDKGVCMGGWGWGVAVPHLMQVTPHRKAMC